MLVVELVIHLEFHQDGRQYLPDVDDVFVGRPVGRRYEFLYSLCDGQC